jgi:hypothetical protein
LILGVHILKGDGDLLYNASYDNGRRIDHESVPSFVKACVCLLHAGESTQLGVPYILRQAGIVWAYAFFDSFVVVVSATEDEDTNSLGRIMLALGRNLAHSFGDVISSWSGNMGEIYEMHDLVAKYVLTDYTHPIDKIGSELNRKLDQALETYHIAYIGILDQNGEMLSGNIPNDHLEAISENLTSQMIKLSSDLVPISIEVKGYTVHVSRIGLYSVVAAGYEDSSRMAAVKAVDDLAEGIRDILLSCSEPASGN